jgi:protocatechuate 3,4-dioxygenase beta subunit
MEIFFINPQQEVFMKTSVNRRQMLGAMAGVAGTWTFFSGTALARVCGLTPKQTQGPFYPTPAHLANPIDSDADLTVVPGASSRAKGEVVVVEGVILDQNCNPVPRAQIEIWQACESGRYNHPNDPNTRAAIDPNFQYWGRMITNAAGEYRFRTIVPGAYPADATWMRPPHIHVKVSCLGYRELVTQMYFAGNPLNERDLILQDLAPAERSSVVVDFQPSTIEPGVKVGKFDISLKKLARP